MQCFFSLPSEEKRSLSVGEILGAISLLLTVLDGVLVEVVDSSDFGTMVADCSRERQNTEVIQSTERLCCQCLLTVGGHGQTSKGIEGLWRVEAPNTTSVCDHSNTV